MEATCRSRRVLIHSLIAFDAGMLFLCALTIALAWKQIPLLQPIDFAEAQTILITDNTGNELGRVFDKRDTVSIRRDQMPQHLRDAIVAIEDERFYARPCIDTRALLRAGFTTILGERTQGASTITQQLIGNLLQNRADRSIRRKVNEILLACRMEHAVSKEDILTLYLNTAPFGGRIYGVEQASRTFFGIHARDLSLAQAAALAALPQQPTALSPYGRGRESRVGTDLLAQIRDGRVDFSNPPSRDEWTIGLLPRRIRGSGGLIEIPGRSSLVLSAMERKGFASSEEIAQARETLPSLAFEKKVNTMAGSAEHFRSLLKSEVTDLVRTATGSMLVRGEGVTVRTTLDPQLQRLAESVVNKFAPSMRTQFQVENIALVAIDLNTRAVLAYVGNVPVHTENPGSAFDMVQVPRQPGSSFKPFVYATAFNEGKFTPESFILDGPLTLGTDKPRNYEGGFWGWIRVKNALAASRNIPAIRALISAGGEDQVLTTAAAAGITTPLTHKLTEHLSGDPNYGYGWTLAIGAAETPLLEMVRGYATLASGGTSAPIRTVAAITEAEDERAEFPLAIVPAEQVIDAGVSDALRDILSNPELRPSGGWRQMLDTGDVEAAVKTGTSNQCRGVDPVTGKCTLILPGDTWTIGFTPSFVVGVWAGNASYRSLSPLADGLDVAAPVWKEFITRAHALRPNEPREFAPAHTFVADPRKRSPLVSPVMPTIDLSDAIEETEVAAH